MTDDEPFLTLIASIQKTAEPQARQLELFDEEAAVVAHRIVKDVIDSILSAGGNLSDLKIQLAVSAARERAVTLLNQRGS
jgi:hypothetical protein